MRILSTKLLSQEEMEFAASLGAQVQCVEVISTGPLSFQLPDSDSYDSIVFTSANALRYFLKPDFTLEVLKYKTFFSIGGKTEQHLLAKGFTPMITAYNGEHLADKIIASGITKTVLHPCSSIRLPVLEQKFKTAGIAYCALPVYHTSPLPNIKVETDYDAILFYSPSGVESFLTENTLPGKVVCCCVGNTTADYLKNRSGNTHIIAPEIPTTIEMLAQSINFLKARNKDE